MKKGWKVIVGILVLSSLIEATTIAILVWQVRELQDGRNRVNTYVHNSEYLWSKQNTFNREYYFKTGNPKRADKEWPLGLQKKENN